MREHRMKPGVGEIERVKDRKRKWVKRAEMNADNRTVSELEAENVLKTVAPTNSFAQFVSKDEPNS